MAILIDETTHVLVQGITGKIGSFHAQEMIEHGTDVVGGVTRARVARGCTTGRCSTPSRRRWPPPAPTPASSSAAALRCRLDHGSGRRRHPGLRRDHRRHPRPGHDPGEALHAALPGREPDAAPGAQLRRRDRPGRCLLGIMPRHIYLQGRVGVVGRSRHARLRGGLADEGAEIGISTSVGIGGDPINGSSFKDALELFEADDGTDAVLMIGEIGGPQEAEAAEFVRTSMSKPVTPTSPGAPKGRKMGHAGAIISAFGESAPRRWRSCATPASRSRPRRPSSARRWQAPGQRGRRHGRPPRGLICRP